MSSVAMWKPPARREYKPKTMDPGQVIVWTVVIPAKWDVEPSYDPETDAYTEGTGWREPETYERIGEIWSAGCRTNTWWAVPDDDPFNPVLVMSTRPKAGGELYQDPAGDGWRDLIRRAENVRKHGVYGTEENERMRTGTGAFDYTRVRWHTDPGCPDAAGKDRGEDSRWNLYRIVDVLTGRERFTWDPPFCKHCVMLEPAPETARELVTA